MKEQTEDRQSMLQRILESVSTRKNPEAEKDEELLKRRVHSPNYAFQAFGKNGRTTIKTKDKKFQNRIGKSSNLSFLDIKLANLMYQCGCKYTHVIHHILRCIFCDTQTCTTATLNLVFFSTNTKPEYADHHSLCPYKE